MMQKVIGVAGFKNAGKTTLVEKLVAELTRRGFAISTIKHAHHSFDIDHEGRDSFRHRKAGATEVAVVSANRWAIIHELRSEAEPHLDDVLANDAHGVVLATHRLTRDGTEHEYQTAHVWNIRDGRFTEWWEYPRDLHAFDRIWG